MDKYDLILLALVFGYWLLKDLIEAWKERGGKNDE